ncbi:xanthine dehydrogenase family protein molybdopterin-binding subunit [Chitinophaga horti]|uniref:Xanthine dehydrogenase family protein molybdopterin-binding subunit n=1 Tax=Chitinophaga horti TaxID=2920382 RepID=A0ABY6J8Q1_9BACT|nr:xanthine dehydrogenase family protein molybdopterin-binding subunit [Chitinophaga horti]UYQ95860.1 xanthine dehydrogenase family protein molybdopterin-binding subunit [Chitinophaga horti]
MGLFDYKRKAKPPVDGRVEGVAKVTGSGKYAAEYEVPNVCHAVLVSSTVAAGTIKSIDVSAAQQADGVLDIVTHLHKPLVPGLADEEKIKQSRFGLPVFHTDKIFFRGQPVAMVIAKTLEDANYAASLVEVTYNEAPAKVDFDEARKSVELKSAGRERGSEAAWNNAAAIIEQEYNIATEVHNPMEMHATIAHWTAADKLVLYDKNQGVMNVQRTFAGLFNIPAANITVHSEFVGGGFGSGLRVWSNALAAIMAALQVKRPVKLMLTRPQMFSLTGYRPASWQKIKLGADANGVFQGLVHQAKNGSSVYENFSEGITRISRITYKFDNLKTEQIAVPLNLGTPTWMRGPGECTGAFALESAIDELSYKLNIDPVELRLKNFALRNDPENGKPYSTNFVDEGIRKGAEMIGWSARKSQPGAITEGDWKIGYGVGIGMWSAGRGTASAGITMNKDGVVTIKTAMTDIGTGTGTAMHNMVHTFTGISKNKIKVAVGHSDLPTAGSQGGSTGLSSISGAVSAVCDALKLKLAGYAADIKPAYKDAKVADVLLSDKGIAFQSANNQFIAWPALWEKHQLTELDVEASSGPGQERQQYSFCVSAAHFAKVGVNIKTGKVKIEKAVCVADGGRIVNEKPAANQVSGAIVGGIGMALMEEIHADKKLGNLVGNDLAGYHFAVNADAPILEVAFVNKPDPNINPSGAKGLGEVGIIGSAAAIANAIYNATGKRLRDLPITPDKILM